MTVSCSRCHDHKLDDISQHDYYALLGVMASSRQVIRTLDLPRHQAELKKKLAASKQKIRRELSGIWMRAADSISVDDLNRRLNEKKAEANRPATMEHPLFAWQTMTNLSNGKTWQEQWNESHAAMKTEHDRRIAIQSQELCLIRRLLGQGFRQQQQLGVRWAGRGGRSMFYFAR